MKKIIYSIYVIYFLLLSACDTGNEKKEMAEKAKPKELKADIKVSDSLNRGFYIFDSKEQADIFLKSLQTNSKYSASSTANLESVTTTKLVDCREAPNAVKWVGLRMEQRGDPKVYVHLTERIVGPGDYEQVDISYMNLVVYKFSWYYSEYYNNEWHYFPEVLSTEAPSGQYYPSIGIVFTRRPGVTSNATNNAVLEVKSQNTK